ncbi:hypothetical protein LSO07_22200 [Janthinobacterium sp. PLB04]|uniref:Uncharacterized protein n=1 Tax=Janthinobacterium lividum TaxID=29581 RepID=A0AAJ4MQP7_9BURK|nr:MULTISPECIES: hypothetical protein [Janthinobacterium]KAB0326208.1 hypothetical protein F3B38_21885 [Janthinobacterium lividum]QSX95334.1 hypothetical protein J3P46_22060 [Janthinobacterium lividum]UGQ35168.1 hypothetical protein LSO07_22200 [Janthinobacterium sp. PLB04]
MSTVAAKTATIARRHLIHPAMTVLVHTHPLVLQLENDLLPLFRAALPPLAAAVPRALASVFAFSSGTASAFQDYHFGISCLLEDMPDDAPEEVALLVSVTGLDAGARLSAQVVWGQPSGRVEMQAELQAGDMPALHAALPGLLAGLQQAASRGRPEM